MLPSPIVCFHCHRAADGHTRYVQDAQGNVVYGAQCAPLRRSRPAAPMTQQGYSALRAIVRNFERTQG